MFETVVLLFIVAMAFTAAVMNMIYVIAVRSYWRWVKFIYAINALACFILACYILIFGYPPMIIILLSILLVTTTMFAGALTSLVPIHKDIRVGSKKVMSRIIPTLTLDERAYIQGMDSSKIKNLIGDLFAIRKRIENITCAQRLGKVK